MFKNKVYLSIGSNIGDRESNIASSIAMLGSYIEISKIRSSSFYKTEPLYNENQPSFLNIVLELETTLTAFQLLDKIHEIERMLGREEKRQKNQPRTIDIDIIIFKDSFIDTPDLQVPHQGALLRKFVMVPLSELASEEIFPKTDGFLGCIDGFVTTPSNGFSNGGISKSSISPTWTEGIVEAVKISDLSISTGKLCSIVSCTNSSSFPASKVELSKLFNDIWIILYTLST